MSVRKAQGSDFAGVLLVLPAEGRQLLISRELLYTALTRFTRKLYLLVKVRLVTLRSLSAVHGKARLNTSGAIPLCITLEKP